MKRISFKVDGQMLKGNLIYPKKLKNKNPAVLFIHGWTSSKKGYIPRAKALTNLGAICLVFNLRGHGNSGGKLEKLSRSDHLQDVLIAFDYLAKQKEVDKNKIGVVGASYGGYMASILSSKKKIKWLVLRAPALYKDKSFNTPTYKLIMEDERVYRQFKIKAQDNRALKSISKYKGDLLLVESEKDEVIPKQTIRNYMNAINPKANFSHKVIKGTDHALGKQKWLLDFIDILVDWFKDKLS